MSDPRFEVATGAIDGSNTIFFVSRSYVAGTTAVFLNGQLKRSSYDDGWTETDPLAGEITLKEAPRSGVPTGDVVEVFFLDTSEGLPQTVLDSISGEIFPEADLVGTIEDIQELVGEITCV